MSGRPWYRWFPGDYLQDTFHLSIDEDCLYRRLLDIHWRDGHIPADPEKIRALARFPDDKFECAWPTIRPFFNKRGGRQNTLVNDRMKSLLDRLSRDLRQKSNAGKARWNKELQANEKRPLCDPDPDPDPEEEKKEEEPLSVSSPHAKSQPRNQRFAEWWACYPKKTGRKPCEAIWIRRQLDSQAERLIADTRDRVVRDVGWLDGFVPNPSTYLNQDRWEDDVKTTRSNGNGRDRHETSFERNQRKLAEWCERETNGRVDAGEDDGVLGFDVGAVRKTLDG